ncbi:AraC family transcriptional regulator [Acetobacteraceae bacterium H6797]|nr:AraC family transcriptional regulator [Acetobacteraceae bacterium H6797]
MGAERLSLVRDRASGVEAIRARFTGHAYDLHRHDEWLVGVTECGVQDFFCRGARRVSTTGRVILIEPGEAHDGQAGHPDGFSYQMLYLPQSWLKRGLEGSPGAATDPAFRATLSDDPLLAAAIGRAWRVLSVPEARLARDAALDTVLAGLRPHLERPERPGGFGRDARVARRARARLQEAMAEDIGADALARAAGAVDRFQLARAFRREYGAAPHAYLVQIRLARARRLLAAGERPAAVAAQCGFADQSHLGRWFKRAYGMTPAGYRDACCPMEAA